MMKLLRGTLLAGFAVGATVIAAPGFAQDEGAKGGWGPDSLLGRASDAEVVLTRDVLAALKRLNPGLPDAAYQDALALVVQDDITKSLIAQNEE